MKCPTCVQQNTTSRVFEGMTLSTLAWSPPFFDEDGVRHVHDPNTHDTSYECTNGHSFSDSRKGWCPVVACEWNVQQHGVGSRPSSH